MDSGTGDAPLSCGEWIEKFQQQPVKIGRVIQVWSVAGVGDDLEPALGFVLRPNGHYLADIAG